MVYGGYRVVYCEAECEISFGKLQLSEEKLQARSTESSRYTYSPHAFLR